MNSLRQVFGLFAVIFAVGCSGQSKRIPSGEPCHSHGTVNCEGGEVCAKIDSTGQMGCVGLQSEPEIIFQLPFDKNTEVVCTQSSQNLSGSHGYVNTLFAIDLTTPYSLPASVVRASAEGKAFVFNECQTPRGGPAKADTDSCGLGYGNHVRILHNDGIASFYVHLDEISVKDGELVKAGQRLGTEGWTGLAGHRHLHWDVHKLNGSSHKEWERILSNPGWGGVSIPYFFKVNINGRNQVLSSKYIKCIHGDMSQTRWKGTE